MTFTCSLLLNVSVSDCVNTGNCLWCLRDRWVKIQSADFTCGWVVLSGLLRPGAPPQGKQFLCRILVCTSSSVYIQPNVVWHCTAFMLESVSQGRLTQFLPPLSSICPFCLLHLSSCFGFSRLKGGSVFPYQLTVHWEGYHYYSHLTLHC